MRAASIACRAEDPCGGVLYPDRAVNDVLAAHSIWRKRYRCLNDHGFWTEAPPSDPPRAPVSSGFVAVLDAVAVLVDVPNISGSTWLYRCCGPKP